MGIFDKIKKGWNEGDQDDGYDNDYYDDNTDDGYETDDYNDQAGYAQQQLRQQQGSGMSLNSSALEMKLIKPERYDSQTAQKIADHLLNRRTVVLNLESTNKESARRLIDFLSGVAYSIDGNIQRVTTNTVVIVPNNVDVSGEQLTNPQKGSNASSNAGSDLSGDDLF